MNPAEKDILLKAYLSLLSYKRASNLLAGLLIIVCVILAAFAQIHGAITAGVIALLAFFHARICQENAKQIRAQVFNPDNREA